MNFEDHNCFLIFLTDNSSLEIGPSAHQIAEENFIRII